MMIDEDKQQYPDPKETTDSTQGGQVAEPTAPNPSNSNAEDGELQLAQAYQQYEASQSTPSNPGPGPGPGQSDGRLADAMEFLKAELEKATQEKKAVEAQLQSTNAQLEEMKNQNRRLAADFDNFRKRTAKEKEELDLQARCATIMELLPVIDNFERARSHIKPQTDTEMAIHKSYQSVYKQMVDCLKRVGVSPMRPEGQPFDPNLHEALLSESTAEYEEGTVLQELERGYLLGERVLRHAKVKVAAAPISVVASEDNPPSSEA